VKEMLRLRVGVEVLVRVSEMPSDVVWYCRV
jgi:hypothetical protein